MNRCKELLADLRSPLALPALAQGCIIGVLLVIIETSLANLIFAEALAPLASRAAGLTIFGAMAMALATGLLSSFKGTVAVPQDIPAAILAGCAASVAAAVAAPEARFATVMALMVASGLLTAAFFLVVGTFRLSNLVRFLPFPVVGGFLGGSGLLLILGGLGVMTGVSPGIDTLGRYLGADLAAHWLPGAGFGLGVFLLLTYRPHYLVLPSCLVGAMALFYVALWAAGMDVVGARAGGWLVGQVPSGSLWPAFGPGELAQVDWRVVLAQGPDLLSVALLATIALLLNMGGVEIGARTDLDMDRELLAGAAANAVSALGGGFSGYGALSLSMLSHRTGVRTRLVPVFAALFCAAVLLAGARGLTYFPLPVLGGLLMLLGMFFFNDWVLSGWKRLTPPDFCVVLAIVATIVGVGFLEGVGLGLVLAILIFLVRFSRVPVIRVESTGLRKQSRLQRPVPERTLLREHGKATRVFELHGYVFFGSACFLSARVGALLKGDKPPAHVVVDLARIHGFDVSAVNNFQRIAQLAQSRGARLALSAVPDSLWALLERNAAPDTMRAVRRFDDLDRALEWAEERTLAAHAGDVADDEGRRRLFSLAYDDLDSHLEAMERFEAVLDALDGVAVERSVAAGEVVLRAGEPLTGVHFVLWGSVGEYAPGGGARVRHLGRGAVLAPEGALGGREAAWDARAEENGVLAYVAREALRALEADDPVACAAVHRLLLRAAVDRD